LQNILAIHQPKGGKVKMKKQKQKQLEYSVAEAGVVEMENGARYWRIRLLFRSTYFPGEKLYDKVFLGGGYSWIVVEEPDSPIPVPQEMIFILNAIASEKALKLGNFGPKVGED